MHCVQIYFTKWYLYWSIDVRRELREEMKISSCKAQNSIGSENLFLFKGNAQFVQNTTFGLCEKNDSSTLKNVL